MSMTNCELCCAEGSEPRFGTPAGPWIRCIAWRPRFTFDGGTVWLCRIWKRHIHKHQYLDGGADWWWQYRRFAAPPEERKP